MTGEIIKNIPSCRCRTINNPISSSGLARFISAHAFIINFHLALISFAIVVKLKENSHDCSDLNIFISLVIPGGGIQQSFSRFAFVHFISS